jgi:hypothetical protein
VGPAGSVEEEVDFDGGNGLRPFQMDIVVTTALGDVFMVDVAVVNPGGTTYIKGPGHTNFIANGTGSALVQGSAAEQRSEGERSKALKFLSPEEIPRFVPFVF